jgi:hypothetical protein
MTPATGPGYRHAKRRRGRARIEPEEAGGGGAGADRTEDARRPPASFVEADAGRGAHRVFGFRAGDEGGQEIGDRGVHRFSDRERRRHDDRRAVHDAGVAIVVKIERMRGGGIGEGGCRRSEAPAIP